MMLGYWLYVSDALSKPRSIDDALLYLHACNRNHAHWVTGYLHREERHYAQYIEGPQRFLVELRRLIQSDGRHRNVRTLMEGSLEERRFTGWDMAFSTSEVASFRTFQRRRRRPEGLTAAPAADILTFMEDVARRGGTIPDDRMRSMAAA